MKTANLYIRVSTDEQAEKGYSQRSQSEALQKYCYNNSIEVRKIIFEDFSAKTFLRPAWQKLLCELRRERGNIDYIFFTRWDRFSRNAGDAYQMINVLRSLGSEPQAIEQPLDLTIPENKLMLAFYLAAPEVENDRRALNTFLGMRRAKKEGRYMGKAPIGYTNEITDDRRKYICLNKNDAPIIKWAFHQIANGIVATDQIRREINKSGIKCGKNNFLSLLRNTVYFGRIKIVKFKDEEESFTVGQHDPIISENLFYKVQNVLNGRKRNTVPRISYEEMLPLRGFLICPRCRKMLTGSASKGRNAYYYYYHCNTPCRYRVKTSEPNEMFLCELKKYTTCNTADEFLIHSILKYLKNQTVDNKKYSIQISTQIEELNNRLKNALNLFADGKIDENDFRKMKENHQNAINILKHKLFGLEQKEKNISSTLKTAIQNMDKLYKTYLEGTIHKKRQIINIIFPDKLCFDEKQSRTGRINEAVMLIHKLSKDFDKSKSQKASKNLPASDRVTPLGLEPRTQRLRVFCSTS